MKANLLICLLSLGFLLPAQAGDSRLSIRKDMFLDYSYYLISEDRVENYSFGPNGMVAVTSGTKEVVTGPVFYWKIEGKTLIISQDQGGSPYAKISFKSITRTEAITTTGEKFRREKVQPSGSPN